jgi:DNA-binding PadR family transcriptional regulator
MEKLGFGISKSQFYRALKILEETGFLKTVDMVLRNGRERKVYELSGRKNEFSKHS